MILDTPLLKRNARIVHGDNQIRIQHLEDEITLEGGAATLFGKILPHLDGRTGLQAIAERVAENFSRVRALTDQLRRADVLTPVPVEKDEARGMSGTEFYALHRKLATHWLRPVYTHPLWDRIVTGQASRAQVVGFAFEKYHYIEGAYEHMAVAAANATPEMMPHLARHFIEEYQHGDIYRKGLCSLFSDEVVLRSQPLPSTRALINFLSESAACNSFAYYAGNELLQMTENTDDGGDVSAIDRFYDAMRQHYPDTGRLIESFIAHTHADQKLGHANVFHEMCEAVPPLTRREVKNALNTVRFMAEHLVLFLDGIEVAYDRLSGVPRLPCDLLSE
jgi:pyrroloquinoline quinone (PQQ) biosynthesis protein C